MINICSFLFLILLTQTIITANFGLCKSVVDGTVTPDTFTLRRSLARSANQAGIQTFEFQFGFKKELRSICEHYIYMDTYNANFFAIMDRLFSNKSVQRTRGVVWFVLILARRPLEM